MPDLSDHPELIESLVESSHFRILLQEQVTHIVQSIQQESKLCTAMIPGIVEEIGSHLGSIIEYKVKNSFNEEYTGYLQQNSTLSKDIQEIKAQMGKIQLNLCETSSLKATKFQGQSQAEPATIEKQKNVATLDNLQIVKLRQQMQIIKQSLQKMSNNNILQFVSETSVELNKKLEERCSRLQHDMMEMSCRNGDTSLDKTMSDIIDLKYETMEQKLEGISRHQKEMIERFKGLESGITEKYETNFANMWKVITNMETNFQAAQSGSPAKKENDLSTLRSFVSPTSRASKKFTFPSILGWK